MHRFQFNRKYFLLACLLFLVEVLIALLVHDRIVRPYVGDYLVVILIYCTVKAFFDTPIVSTTISVLLFAFAIEILQYFHLVDLLGLQNSSIARIVIGSSFEWIDLIAYTLGCLTIVATEKYYQKEHRKKAANRLNSSSQN